jgi:UDP-N-acetyl-D-mannosaminuronate dehydrogenase
MTRCRNTSLTLSVTLGRTYKADVTDVRESPALHVAEGLRRGGATVREHDAMLDKDTSVEDLSTGADAIVLLVEHAAYRALPPSKLAPLMRRALIVDTRGVLSREDWTNASFEFVVLGGRNQ